MIKRVLAFSSPAYLSLRNEQIVVKLPNAKDGDVAERTAPIEDIGVVVLDNQQITITQGLMAALLANNVALITCDGKHLPTGMFLTLEGHNLQSERFRAQIQASEPLRKNLWQQTIQQKIKNQSAILSFVGCENGNMQKWAATVKSGDSDNLEARAAAYYWKNIFTEYPDFLRGQDEAYPNNLLNYGYAIVRAMMARALVASGLLPTFGIHHHNRYNAYCLADDIMEPYRPYVDKVVLEMLNKYEPTEDISQEMKRDLFCIPVMDVLIDGHRSPLMVAIQTTAVSVQKCYSGEIRKIVFPEM